MAMDARRIVTLLSDFGTRDGYVAAMKGVVLSAAPDARLVDAGHEVAPYDVRAAAWVLRQYAGLYPPGTIHVAVVDPGVGTARRALAVEADGRYYLAPDNGLLWWILQSAREARVGAMRPDVYRGRGPSSTFHGRDVFAHAAGQLAAGREWEELAEPCAPDARPQWGEPLRDGAGWLGEVIHVDRFGNLVTNLTAMHLQGIDRRLAIFTCAGHRAVGLSRTYADVPPGQPVAYLGSDGHVELGLNQGSAAASWGAQPGSSVVIP